jgi:anti-anti-sigma factor
MELTITRSTDESGQDIMVVAGSIDLVTRQSLLDEGRSVLEQGGPLTLDMAEVEFIDSTGIGALIELARLAEAQGTAVRIARSSARVTRVLEFSGLDNALGARSAAPDAGTEAR